MNSKFTCVILAGGLGSRLQSVLPDTPKPMASINGYPFLEYLLRQVRQARLTDVILCLAYKAEAIESHFADGTRYGVQIRYSVEREPLGTAEALFQAKHMVQSDPFVVMNGDSYCEVSFGELITQHQARNAVATIVTTWVEDKARYGSVAFGPQDTITGFCEKGVANGSGYINGGIYVFSRLVLDLIPSGSHCSIERDIFSRLAGHGLHAVKTSGTFIDIGIPSELQRAQTVLKDLASTL